MLLFELHLSSEFCLFIETVKLDETDFAQLTFKCGDLVDSLHSLNITGPNRRVGRGGQTSFNEYVETSPSSHSLNHPHTFEYFASALLNIQKKNLFED